MRSTQAADSVLTYININHGGWVTAGVIRLGLQPKHKKFAVALRLRLVV